jgi:Rieske Fe-S protein
MRRRDLFQLVIVSALALGLKGRTSVLASAAQEGLRIPAPMEPWDKVEFSYAADQQSYPGIAVRLPAKANAKQGELYTVCRICPHQGCPLNYETEYRKVGDMVGASLENPVFFCHCHMSIFDPAQRGKVVYGPANRPPWTFSFRAEKSEIVITGVEKGIGQFR